MREIIKSEDIKLNSIKYADIINLPHHKSPKREPMKLQDRAAQFMPFAALTGFEEAVWETARVTQKRRILSEDQKNELDIVLRRCIQEQDVHPELEIVYFIEDQIKEGGQYCTTEGKLLRVDTSKMQILLENQPIINMNDIFTIQFV